MVATECTPRLLRGCRPLFQLLQKDVHCRVLKCCWCIPKIHFMCYHSLIRSTAQRKPLTHTKHPVSSIGSLIVRHSTCEMRWASVWCIDCYILCDAKGLPPGGSECVMYKYQHRSYIMDISLLVKLNTPDRGWSSRKNCSLHPLSHSRVSVRARPLLGDSLLRS